MYTLVVWHIPKSACEEDLRGLFAEFGEVVDVRFSNGRKYGLVTFYDRQSAERALSSSDLFINGHPLMAKMARWSVM